MGVNKKSKISLYEHNQKAYKSALSIMGETGKAAIVHPTGTGKSFIGFKLAEDYSNTLICWLSPSEYIFNTQIENLKKTGVDAPNNIIFITYAKLMNMSEDEIEEIQPHYIVLDEFHRCGAEMWGKGVQTLLKMYPDAPILGLSATNIRYLDNQRDMADELFDGNIASEITLGEAIVRNILLPPKYIISVYSYQKDLEKYQQRIRRAKSKVVRDTAQRYLDALRRTLKKADGLDVIFDKHMTERHGKYIVFCANYEHMCEMIDKAPEWFYKVDAKPRIYSVYSDDPESSDQFRSFKEDNNEDHLRLLYCIDTLNEGVHVDDVSGVILLRPTISPIIYKQQIGRAMTANKGNNKAAVIFDIVDNISSIYSIGTIQEEMQVAINYYRSWGNEEPIVNERFKIIDEVRDCKEIFDSLNNALSMSWDQMYDVARAYYAKHGNLTPINTYKTPEGYSLGQWLATQRNVRKGITNGILTEEQINKLDAIEMRWENYTDIIWVKNYNALLKYKEAYGNIDVPSRYITDDNISLGRWVQQIRVYESASIRNDILTPDHKKALDDLGMIWDKVNHIWEVNYQAASKYYREHQNLDIPRKCKTEDGIALGTWIHNIRYYYRKTDGNNLTLQQKERLQAIGLNLSEDNLKDIHWKKNYKKAKQYYIEHGNLDVPYNYKTIGGFALGHWIRRHRSMQSNKTSIIVTDERKKMLDEIGMIWDPVKTGAYDKYITLSQKYYAEHGNLDLSSSVKFEGEWLGNWVSKQKAAYKTGELSQKSIDMLESIGIVWLNDEEKRWENNFEAAKAYYEINGNLSVPKEMKQLYTWLIHQRKNYKNKRITEEQYSRLTEIGMVWEFDSAWEKAFIEAHKYYVQNGNLDIPTSYVTDDGIKLGSWYRSQRNQYKNGILSDEKIIRLRSIGMHWEPVKDRAWMQLYERAKDYYQEHNNLRVNIRHCTPDGLKLGVWISSQRSNYSKNTLSDYKIKLLDEIGMEWNRNQSEWNTAYKYAEQYFAEHNDLNVIVGYKSDDGFKLGTWLSNQRIKYKKDELTQNQIDRLEKLGITWSPFDEIWNKSYEYAKQYYFRNGSINVKVGYITEDGFRLGQWIYTQKKKYKDNALSEEKIVLLKQLGVNFD